MKKFLKINGDDVASVSFNIISLNSAYRAITKLILSFQPEMQEGNCCYKDEI